MARFFMFLLLASLGFLPLHASSEEEALQTLISRTEQNLHSQELLLTQLKQFSQAKALYLNNTENKKQAKEMVTHASLLLNQLSQSHLEHIFSQDFLDELRFFSQFSDEQDPLDV